MNHAPTIRFWLMQQPRPASLRLTCGDDVRALPIAVNATWAKVSQTVAAMAPELLEALDDKGALLRATRGEEENELAPETTTTTRANAPASPPAMVDVQTLQLMAKLLAEAYKHSTETAFAKLGDLFAVVSKRSENLERSLELSERARTRQMEQLLSAPIPDEAGTGEITLQDLLAQFMGGKQAAQVPAPATPTNGKGH